jgi:hypothetical protein
MLLINQSEFSSLDVLSKEKPFLGKSETIINT